MPEIKYPVIEIFSSIQGEGTHMGLAATFIRLAGCNLRCSWCDTQNAFDFKEAKWLTASEISQLESEGPLVVITGGEPTMHELGPLVAELHKRQKYVALETNGTHAVPASWDIDWITASPKPVSDYILLCKADELKYVVDDTFTLAVIAIDAVPAGRIFLQVESARAESARKAYSMVTSHPTLELRLGIQLHKVLGVE